MTLYLSRQLVAIHIQRRLALGNHGIGKGDGIEVNVTPANIKQPGNGVERSHDQARGTGLAGGAIGGAGELGGRRLTAPGPGELAVRPTPDRVREALFSALQSRIDLGGARVLDLGCGDGDLLAHLQDDRQVNGYGLEIDPAYCDVIVQRWEAMTGKNAKRQKGGS